VVLLSEIIPIPIGPLSDRVLLAGQQHVLVLYLDGDGESLDGHGLAELTLSPGLELCDDGLGSLEFHCLSIEEAGAHVLEVTVGGERLVLPFEAVLESDNVEIEVLQPDEEALEPGTWVQVDVVGVTEDGTHVTSIHPRFIADGVPYLGYFAYQYDPDISARLLEIEALDEKKRSRFRGTPSDKSAFRLFSCESAVSGSGGPVPALVTLLGLVFLVRRAFRKINEAG
jgi:MYXO-CTERM domain-containing protein